MFVIAGLGNPGIEYALTRHNAGFLGIDNLAGKYNMASYKKKFDALVAEGVILGQKVLLLKPETFMNNSGNSIMKALHFYKQGPEKLIVIHDELDLPFGAVRLKSGGGTAGHNGLNSIVRHLGQEFTRIRIGIQKREVLGRFSADELEALPAVLDDVVGKVEGILKNGV